LLPPPPCPRPSGAPYRSRPLYLCLFGLLLMGCLGDDQARFEATLAAHLSCAAARFPFSPSLFAATRTNNGAFIRMASQGNDRLRADGLYIAIAESPGLTALQACPSLSDLTGQTLPVGPDQCAQAYLRFGSCLRDFTSLHVVGTLVFDELSFDEGKRISGRIAGDLEEITYREVFGERVVSRERMGSLEGTFDFAVRVGPPFQMFATQPGSVYRP